MNQPDERPTDHIERVVLAAFLRSACQLVGSQRSLARAANVHPATLSRITRGGSTANWITVDRVWRTFGQAFDGKVPALSALVASLVRDVQHGRQACPPPDNTIQDLAWFRLEREARRRLEACIHPPADQSRPKVTIYSGRQEQL